MNAATMTDPIPGAHIAWATFPADRRSPGAARRFVLAQLRAWGCDEVGETATLIVSELVTNGVLHAGTPVGVAVGCDGTSVAVAVTDGVPDGIDPACRSTRHPRGAPSGRGLQIVAALSDDWGTSVHDRGKTVWCEIARRALARAQTGAR